MEIHGLATIWPGMTDQEYAELKQSIREIGLQEAITTLDGKLLDGRHRYRACSELGVEAKFKELEKGIDLVAFVKAKNFDRRMLNESQRAMVAARLANLPNGTNQHGGAGGNGKEGDGIQPPSFTSDEAAKRFQVCRDSVTVAKYIIREGIPELSAAVCDGKVKLYSARKIARLAPCEQPAALEEALQKVCPSGRRQPRKRLTQEEEHPCGPDPKLRARLESDCGTGPAVDVAADNAPDCQAPAVIPMATATSAKLVEAEAAAKPFRQLAKELKAVMRRGAKAAESPLAKHFDAAKFEHHFGRAIAILERATPYAACPFCEGEWHCLSCKGAGWVPRHVYEKAKVQPREVIS